MDYQDIDPFGAMFLNVDAKTIFYDRNGFERHKGLRAQARRWA